MPSAPSPIVGWQYATEAASSCPVTAKRKPRGRMRGAGCDRTKERVDARPTEKSRASDARIRQDRTARAQLILRYCCKLAVHEGGGPLHCKRNALFTEHSCQIGSEVRVVLRRYFNVDRLAIKHLGAVSEGTAKEVIISNARRTNDRDTP